MKKPRDTVTTPQDDWQYKQPDTGKEFKHSNPNVLFHQVWEHRLSLPDYGMDVSGGWKDRLWNDICDQNPYLLCDSTEDKGTWVGMGDIWRFLWSMKDWVTGGMKLVEPEVAEKRARVCTGADSGKACPNNQAINSCWGCKGVGRLLDSLLGPRTIPSASKLETCAACKCLLRAKVWLPQEAIHFDPEKTPSFCWMNQKVEEVPPSS